MAAAVIVVYFFTRGTPAVSNSHEQQSEQKQKEVSVGSNTIGQFKGSPDVEVMINAVATSLEIGDALHKDRLTKTAIASKKNNARLLNDIKDERNRNSTARMAANRFIDQNTNAAQQLNRESETHIEATKHIEKLEKRKKQAMLNELRPEANQPGTKEGEETSADGKTKTDEKTKVDEKKENGTKS